MTGGRGRRKRYAGAYPRRFEDRYKELDPARHPGEAAKVRGHGRTPAGTHVPVMLAEVLEALEPRPGDVYLDCTLGWGGHAEAIGRIVGPAGRTIGIDLDAEEQARTVQRLAGRGVEVHAHHANFAGLAAVLAAEGVSGADVVLADLGVSSMQLDRPDRGFSFKHDGPLDMRMDRSRGATAAELLARSSAETLEELLCQAGDEPDAARVATAIRAAFDGPTPPRTSLDLARVVLAAKGLARYRQASPGDTHPAARVFQAVRMAVNREAANLEHLSRILPSVLVPGGRAAILTFHGGEERLVRDALRSGLEAGVWAQADRTGVKASAAEVAGNPRARSARLFAMRRVRPGPP